jgi:hypothetical protein
MHPALIQHLIAQANQLQRIHNYLPNQFFFVFRRKIFCCQTILGILVLPDENFTSLLGAIA